MGDVRAHGVDLRLGKSGLDNSRFERRTSPKFPRSYGNFAVTHWMPVRPALGVDTDWHAIARPDDGSWNQTVLAFPLDDTPIGTKIGVAITCDRAIGSETAATTMAAAAMVSERTDVSLMMISGVARGQ
jgi:hypothetical protein